MLSLGLQLLLRLLLVGVSAVGAFGFVGLAGALLLPVGLAVLVDEAHLGLRGELLEGWRRGMRRGWRRGAMMVVLVVTFRLHRAVRGGQGLHDLAVQDPQGHSGYGVFEVVLGGEAVIETSV